MNRNFIQLMCWLIAYDITKDKTKDEHKRLFRNIYDYISNMYKIESQSHSVQYKKRKTDDTFEDHRELGNKMINFYHSHFESASHDTMLFVERLQNGKYDYEFKQLEMIGSGNFGSVFKAKNLIDDEHYAIKKVQINGTTFI
jgi:hypothetical protein